ncbi:MAG TPA: DUF2027 domain-containing protein [Bacteroidales bacterium]|nr:DUF2027 domain-containing protein [Bacteroidales bacterium]HSA42911.1 DUF2027 domain-containing protein [Bacteroidales bacterium]
MLQPGDRVKFLNEKGGGIVTKVISPSLVSVMVEEGFEIPTATGDLIKIDNLDAAGRLFQDKLSVPMPSEGGGENIPIAETLIPLQRISNRKDLPAGVYLSFIPHDQKWLITGSLDIFIINHTPFEVLYTYFLYETDGTYTLMDSDSIPALTRLYLQTVDREEIPDWNRGVAQMLFSKESMNQMLPPASCQFHIKEKRFLDKAHYVETPFAGPRMLISPLVELSRLKATLSKDKDSGGDRLGKHIESNDIYRESPLIEKYRTGDKEAEVDLHIEELVEDESVLDAGQTLGIQLDFFKRCLESAIENAYRKVIFIHGVGNGTLKSEIRQLLDGREGLHHQIAPMARFGVGAIEVTIRS